MPSHDLPSTVCQVIHSGTGYFTWLHLLCVFALARSAVCLTYFRFESHFQNHTHIQQATETSIRLLVCLLACLFHLILALLGILSF